MTKKKKTPFGIFTESIGLYFSNFGQFVKYMSFPVLGQVIGLVIIFACTGIYTANLPELMEKYPIFKEFNTLVFASIVVALPGMIILLKAFWEYLVAYGAINSMLENMLKSGKVYDFDAHTELIKRRSVPFVGLWLIIGIFSLLAIFPLLWIPAGVIGIYLVLIFQVFTYEPELSPVGCIRKSFNLIKGHFASTFILVIFAGLLTYVFIPQSICTLFEWSGGTKFIAGLIMPFVNQLPLEDLNITLAYYHLPLIESSKIALTIVSAFIAQILIQYTLPMRSLLWGMWYKELNGSIPAVEKKKRSSKRKKPSEILMENTHKRVVSEKLDRNIIKRAMEGVKGVNEGENSEDEEE